MKRLLLSITLLTALFFPSLVSGQTSPRELIAANSDYAYGNFFPYQPMDSTAVEAPNGYELFHISYFGRHGSRYDQTASKDKDGMGLLQRLHDQGKLSDEGERMYSEILQIREAMDANLGELTDLGRAELEGLGHRMYASHKDLFTDGAVVETYSTTVHRVMESREKFLVGLTADAPALKITLNDSRTDSWARQEVEGCKLTREQKELLGHDGHIAAAREKKWAESDFSTFASRVLNNPADAGNAKMFAYRVYTAVICSRCLGTDFPDISRYFTTDELYSLWERGNYNWFSRHSITPDNEGVRSDIVGRAIVEAIISDAQDVISGRNKAAAILRFSHDTYLHPMLSFMDVEGANCSDLDNLANQSANFVVVRTAANFRLLFYRNAQNQILVLPMLNEKPCRIGKLKPAAASFYHWNDVRKFWNNRVL